MFVFTSVKQAIQLPLTGQEAILHYQFQTPRIALSRTAGGAFFDKSLKKIWYGNTSYSITFKNGDRVLAQTQILPLEHLEHVLIRRGYSVYCKIDHPQVFCSDDQNVFVVKFNIACMEMPEYSRRSYEKYVKDEKAKGNEAIIESLDSSLVGSTTLKEPIRFQQCTYLFHTGWKGFKLISTPFSNKILIRTGTNFIHAWPEEGWSVSPNGQTILAQFSTANHFLLWKWNLQTKHGRQIFAVPRIHDAQPSTYGFTWWHDAAYWSPCNDSHLFYYRDGHIDSELALKSPYKLDLFRQKAYYVSRRKVNGNYKTPISEYELVTKPDGTPSLGKRLLTSVLNGSSRQPIVIQDFANHDTVISQVANYGDQSTSFGSVLLHSGASAGDNPVFDGVSTATRSFLVWAGNSEDSVFALCYRKYRKDASTFSLGSLTNQEESYSYNTKTIIMDDNEEVLYANFDNLPFSFYWFDLSQMYHGTHKTLLVPYICSSGGVSKYPANTH